MLMKQLTDKLFVAPQIAVSDISALQAEGFTTLIANRPDGEEAGQPSMDDIAQAAQDAGLTWVYQPIVSGAMTLSDATQFGHTVAEATGKVLAFCRTGTRCTTLWALSEGPKQDADDIIRTAANAGYDVSGLRQQFNQLRQS